MPHSEGVNHQTPSGLLALLMVLHKHQQYANPAQLLEQFSSNAKDLDLVEIRQAAESLDFKTGLFKADWQGLVNAPKPIIAQSPEGYFFVIDQFDGEKFLIHDPLENRPRLMPQELFEQYSNGQFIRFKKRFKLNALPESIRQFDIGWFVPAMMKHKKLFAEVLMASLFVQLISLGTPLMFQVIVDKVLVHQGMSTLSVIGFAMLMLAFFEMWLTYERNRLSTHTSSRIDVLLGSRVFQHLIRLPMTYFEARRVGDSVARIRELDTIRQFLTGSSLTLVIDLLFTLVFFAVLFLYSPLLTAIVAATIPLLLILSLAVTPVLRARLNKKFEHGADNQAFLVESVSGIKTVKSMAVETRWQRLWEEKLASFVSSNYKVQQISNFAMQAATLINRLAMVLVLWVGAMLVMENQLTIGQLIAFNMIAMRISSPVLRLVQLWQDFQQTGLSIRRLGEVLNTPAEMQQHRANQRIDKLQGKIEFRQVGFRYRVDQPRVLNDFSLKIMPGEVIGIAGESGSGKSTLTRLLQRLNHPETGQVLIDNYDLATLDLDWLRQQVTVVSQDNFLFNLSIRDNIALACPAASDAQIIEAARLAGAHEFIQSMPDGYATMIEEQGVNLSAGQRQRLAIARALMTNPKILIFDEATSALDYESENLIQQHMQKICRQRTVIIIAHRLNTLSMAHRIVCLQQGRIIEQGSWQQLLSQQGYFHRLYQAQLNKTRLAGKDYA